MTPTQSQAMSLATQSKARVLSPQVKKQLEERIRTKTARLGVVGLGYVGIPLAARFAEEGFQVTGFDINPEKVESLNAGQYPMQGEEPGMPELVAQVVQDKKFYSSTDPDVLKGLDIIFIVVDTPLDKSSYPPKLSLINLEKACQTIGERLKSGMMVVTESTLAPLTNELLIVPILEEKSNLTAGVDFALVHCPERVMPGLLLERLTNMTRIVGGINPESSELAISLYAHIVHGELKPTNLLVAEITKTGENAYRDMEIAFANELAQICEEYGANFWEVRECINSIPLRNVHKAGAGVGGHCIPKDPWLFIGHLNQFHSQLIPAARAVNDYMPVHMKELLADGLREAGVDLSMKPRIAVLGSSYLENSDDTRDTPTQAFLEALRKWGIYLDIVVQDPYVQEYKHKTWQEAVRKADAVVIMVAHRQYQEIKPDELKRLMRGKVVIDGRNVIDKQACRNAGLIYKGVGNTV